MMTTPFDSAAFIAELSTLAQEQGWKRGTVDREVARHLDLCDPLAPLRDEYLLPSAPATNANSKDNGQDSKHAAEPGAKEQGPLIYLCGNSLGPLARRSKQYVEEELDVWRQYGVVGHFDHPYGRPWARCEEKVSILMSDIVGAKPNEVVAMGTLTANLHAMLATFYRPQALGLDLQGDSRALPQSSVKPTRRRHKIIYEASAFPSDQYALTSVVAMAGHDPRTSLVALQPRIGERTIRTEDTLAVLEREAATDELALILLGDVQYLTGQMFDVASITRRARELGIIVGWDLAHAFANVPLALHDWDVDFAVWCTYKYGSSGPGGIAGIFVHERWGQRGFSTRIGRDDVDKEKHATTASTSGLPRPAGWWGHEKSTRFAMPDSFTAISGAAGWQQSNPSALDAAALLGSLETLALAPKILLARSGESEKPAACTQPLPSDFGSSSHAAQCDAHNGPVGWGHIMPALRQKSQRLTAYLEHLLMSCDVLCKNARVSIVTPSEARFRGSQLSLCIPDSTHATTTPESLARATSKEQANGQMSASVVGKTLVVRVHHRLESEHGLICDMRNPDMLRIAPVAQYSTFDEVWRAADAIRRAVAAELS